MDPRPDLDPDTTHPVILWTDLYAEDPRGPQTQFVLDRQIAFLEALATTGSVRAAARRVQVSHQTCYRARRNSAAFGRAWDAALVIARGRAEAELADCALNGRREEVWYHGDMVGYRTRFSDRLLLAHLARLDRLRTDHRIEALAEDFDGMLRRMRLTGEVGEGGDPTLDVENSRRMEPHTPNSVRTELVSRGDSFASEVQPPKADQANVLRQAQHERGEGDERDSMSGAQEGDTLESATGEISSSGPRSMRSKSGDGRPPAACAEEHQPCQQCGGPCADPGATLTQADCQWFGNRLERMLDAVPEGEVRERNSQWDPDKAGMDEIHIEAFEAGLSKWWLIASEEELEARLRKEARAA